MTTLGQIRIVRPNKNGSAKSKDKYLFCLLQDISRINIKSANGWCVFMLFADLLPLVGYLL